MISSCSDTRNYDPVALEIVQVETPIGISTKTDSNWILYWHESSRYSKMFLLGPNEILIKTEYNISDWNLYFGNFNFTRTISNPNSN